MKNYLLTTFMVVFLFSQQSAVADGKKRYRHYHADKQNSYQYKYRFYKSRGFPHRVGAELVSLKNAVIALKAEVENLKSLAGSLPPDLIANLSELQAKVDSNSSDISLALTDIVNIMQDVTAAFSRLNGHTERLNQLDAGVADINLNLDRIGITVSSLESRIAALEQTPPPTDDLVFSANFTAGAAPTAALEQAWDEFRSNSSGDFASIEIKNSFNAGIVCSDPVVATQIAGELNTHVPVPGMFASFDCQGVLWNVGSCSATGADSVELNAGSNAAVCLCGQGAVVRPKIGSANWGGIGSEFGGSGGTCGAPAQTLEVVLTR